MEGVQVVGNGVTLCMPKLTHRGSIIAPRAKSDVYDRVVYWRVEGLASGVPAKCFVAEVADTTTTKCTGHSTDAADVRAATTHSPMTSSTLAHIAVST